jgi:type II secretory pathway component GspD/PulD (secretin)
VNRREGMRHLRRLGQSSLAFGLAFSLLFAPCTALDGWAASPATKPPRDADIVQIRGGISVGAKGNEVISSLSLRDADIKDVLYSIAEQADINLIVDDAVEGTISVDLKNVSVNKVLEYVMTLADLTYYRDGNTFIITTAENASEKSLNRVVLKSIRVKYSNAQEIAQVLSQTIFNINRPGGNAQAIVTADPRTNSILVMGNQSDIDLVNRALAELDFPVERKTYFLKNARPIDVADAISQTMFSVGLVAANALNGVAGAGGIGGQAGANTVGGVGGGVGGGIAGGGLAGAGGLGATGGVGATTGVGGTAALGTTAGATGGAGLAGGGTTNTGAGGIGGGAGSGTTGGINGSGVQVLRGGPMTFIANQMNNTLTMIGTAELIDQAEKMLYDVDIRLPQVAIQVSIVQVDENRNKGFRVGFNSNAPGQGNFQGRNGGFFFNGGSSTIFLSKNGTGANTTGSKSLLENLQFNSTFNLTKGKLLANPTVIALSGRNASINVTRQIFAGNQVIAIPGTTVPGGALSQPLLTNVGIQLNITPTVDSEGTVRLSLSPSVSAPSGSVDAGASGTITLTSNSNLSVQDVRVQDGETLVLGGLIQELSTAGVAKFPFLSDIPIIGALFRANQTNTTTRSELLILVTPHIIKEEGVPYFRKDWRDQLSYAQYHSFVAGEPPILPDDNPLPVNAKQSNLKLVAPKLDRTVNEQSNNALPLSPYTEVLK